MKGYIHSTESFGTVDGPGIRYVIFMQGCPMRCLYCHNPDTWEMRAGREIDVETVLREFNKNRAFYRDGGITVTGGEPLLQVDFLIELFRAAKKDEIHTCIDTSGITYSRTNTEYVKKLDELMGYTDLVMLDIKHIDSERHIALTGKDNKSVLDFARYLEEKDVPLVIRHVVTEGYTDGEEHLYELGMFIGRLRNLKALDVLPYHSMGEKKYEEMGIYYPLHGMRTLDKSAAERAKNIIMSGIRKARAKG